MTETLEVAPGAQIAWFLTPAFADGRAHRTGLTVGFPWLAVTGIVSEQEMGTAPSAFAVEECYPCP